MMPTGGMIITSDGSHYNPPQTTANKEEYVPLNFAKAKVAEVVADLKATKDSYSKYIAEQHSSHSAAMESTKAHYESYIIDVRSKAKRHIDLLKQMKAESETSLNATITQHTETIDMLRDLLDTEKINAAEYRKATEVELSALQSELLTQLTCQKALLDTVSNVERIHLDEKNDLNRKELLACIFDLQATVDANFSREQQLMQEIEFHSVHISRIAQLEAQLSNVGENHNSLVVERDSLAEKMTQLQSLRVDNDALRLELSQLNDDKQQVIAKHVEEKRAIDLSYNSLVVEKESLLKEISHLQFLRDENEALQLELSLTKEDNQKVIVQRDGQNLTKSEEELSVSTNPKTQDVSKSVEFQDQSSTIIDLQDKLSMAVLELTELKNSVRVSSSSPSLNYTEKDMIGISNPSSPILFQYTSEVSSTAEKTEILYDDLIKERKALKNEISEWLHSFEIIHGHAATTEDKQAIKDKYKRLKVLTGRAEMAKEALDALRSRENPGNILQAQIQPVSEHTSSIPFETKSSTMPFQSLELTATPSKVMSSSINDQMDRAEIVALEDALADMNEKLRELNIKISTKDNEIALSNIEIVKLNETIQMLVTEKRTDVVKRLEEENNSLRTSLSEHTVTISELKAYKTKTETKLKELQDRCNNAERELDVRDAADAKSAQPNEEKSVLKTEIKKQREDLVLKTAAATAGWNAVADLDEKLEVEVERAYQRGVEETKKILATDSKDLHESLEKKEERITELLVLVTTAEKAKRDSEAEIQRILQNMSELQQHVVDLQSEGSGGGVNGAFVSEDLQRARDELDNSQEEVVQLSEKLSTVQRLLTIANEKIKLYQNILSSQSSSGSDSQKSALTSSSTGRQEGHLIELINKALQDGANLWRQSKKDETFDLYFSVCKQCLDKSGPDHKAILTGVITANTIPSDASAVVKSLKKGKGVPALRVALEKVLNSLNTLSSASTSTVSSAVEAKTEFEMRKLKKSLADLDEQESELDTSDTSAAPMASASSVLRRAQEAERQVSELREKILEMKNRQFSVPQFTIPSSTTEQATLSETTTATPVLSTKKLEGIELRRLQRRIMELEQQHAKRGQVAGGDVVDTKALAAVEKKFQKQIKELEAASKKEKATLEKEKAQLEKTIKTNQTELSTFLKDKDEMMRRVSRTESLEAEVIDLRVKAEKFAALSIEHERVSIQLSIVSAQLTKESALRKKYKNELEDLKGNIRVYARCRPFAQYEVDRNCKQVVEFVDDTGLKVMSSRGEKQFEFDTVFNMNSTQEQVFEDTQRLVESFLDGFNVCLFAYGQTGSGKTFTMTGSSSMPGLTPRAIEEIFRLVREKRHCTCKISTYFMELYNDALVDLFWILDNKRGPRKDPPRLDIKVNEKQMVVIPNAVVKEVSSGDELMELFRLGNQERHVGATLMNAESSRSHSIFSILAEVYDSTSKRTTYGKLSLVDLAGSERADKTGASADRLKEAQSINKSLSALGNVISALSDGVKFIPYRDNKLTQLMQDSLGGNAKTLMFVNFSPADYNSDETVSSLSYATRVKKITNNIARQAESEEVTRLKNMIKRLQVDPNALKSDQALAAAAVVAITESSQDEGYTELSGGIDGGGAINSSADGGVDDT